FFDFLDLIQMIGLFLNRFGFNSPQRTKSLKTIADRRYFFVVIQTAQLGNRRGSVFADRKHAQAMAMKELERRITFAHFRPKAPNAEVFPVFVGIVRQYYRSVGQLGLPGCKIMAYRLIGMVAIHVE